MNKILIPFSLALISLSSSAQTISELDLEPYFSAIIVNNIDSSIHWYEDVLGFEMVNRVDSEEYGFKQSNLKRGASALELIEMNKAVEAKDHVPNYNSKTRLVGFFKTGFIVSDFDAWINHLKEEQVEFYGDVVKDTSSGKRMVIITDPDGNRIQIFER